MGGETENDDGWGDGFFCTTLSATNYNITMSDGGYQTYSCSDTCAYSIVFAAYAEVECPQEYSDTTSAPNGGGTFNSGGTTTSAPNSGGTFNNDGTTTSAPNGGGTFNSDGTTTLAPNGDTSIAPKSDSSNNGTDDGSTMTTARPTTEAPFDMNWFLAGGCLNDVSSLAKLLALLLSLTLMIYVE